MSSSGPEQHTTVDTAVGQLQDSAIRTLEVGLTLAARPDALSTLATGNRYQMANWTSAPGLHGLYQLISLAQNVRPEIVVSHVEQGFVDQFVGIELARLPEDLQKRINSLWTEQSVTREQRIDTMMRVLREVAPYIFDTPQWIRNAPLPIGQMMMDRAYALEHIANMPEGPEKVAAQERLRIVQERETLDWSSYDDNSTWLGGGFAEIERHLPEIITHSSAVYLSPIFQATYVDALGQARGKMHGYNTVDFGVPDPHYAGYGSEAIVKATPERRREMGREALLQFAHLLDKGFRPILDIATNHTSDGFFAFQDIVQNGQHSPYANWYRKWFRDDGTVGGYSTWWGNADMPELNHYEPQVEGYFLGDFAQGVPFAEQNSQWQAWVKRLKDPEQRDMILANEALLKDAQQTLGIIGFWSALGIGGWRADVPGDLGRDEFWAKFRSVVKTIDPEIYMVAEAWDHEHDNQDKWLRGEYFDATMNYAYLQWTMDFFFGPNGRRMQHMMGQRSQNRNAYEFQHEVEAFVTRYPEHVIQAMLTISGSHDIPRLADHFADFPHGHLAFPILGTLPGVMSVWLGDEVGTSVGDATVAIDSQNRKPPAYDLVQDGDIWVSKAPRNAISHGFKQVSRLREQHPSLRSAYISFFTQDTDVISYIRTEEANVLTDDAVAMLINRSSQPKIVSLPQNIQKKMQLLYTIDQSGSWAEEQWGGQQNTLVIPPFGARILTTPVAA